MDREEIVTKEDYIKYFTDTKEKSLRNMRIAVEKKYSGKPYFDKAMKRMSGLIIRSTEHILRELEEVLEKSKEFNLDENECVAAILWFNANKDESRTRMLSAKDIDGYFLDRIQLGRTYKENQWNKYNNKAKYVKLHEDKDFMIRYRRDYIGFFRDLKSTFYSYSEGHSNNARSKQEWSRQGMNPMDDDTPDDWENYRTDELID